MTFRGGIDPMNISDKKHKPVRDIGMKKKTSKAAAIVLGILFIGYIGAINLGLAHNPIKITDPAHPRFNPDKFRYSDYYNNEDISLVDAYTMLFPPGTPKEFVDRVLVKAGGATVSCAPNRERLCFYTRPARLKDIKGGHKDLILFDTEYKIIRGRYHDDFDVYSHQYNQQIDNQIGEQQ